VTLAGAPSDSLWVIFLETVNPFLPDEGVAARYVRNDVSPSLGDDTARAARAPGLVL
jgi:hypothetical protein